jgi:hypothetical protein
VTVRSLPPAGSGSAVIGWGGSMHIAVGSAVSP